jgi:glyoxylase-like metal-dependent hydrolase (beta-lactamase superfamily II)
MAPSLDELVKQGEGDQDAIDLGDGVFMSRNIANSYLVTTADGDVMINTGTDFEAPGIKSRFSRVSTGPLRMITFTQGHPDHVGGWSEFTGQGSRRSLRPTTPTSASTGATFTPSTSDGS